MTGPPQPLRVEGLGSGTKHLGHLGPAEISLSRGTATRVLTALKSLNRRLQSILASASDELSDQGPKPVRRILLHLPSRLPGSVKDGIAGTQQSQAPVAGGFRICKSEKRFSKGAVRDSLIAHV